MKKTMEYVDIEPTYMEIFNAVKFGALKIEFSNIDKACAIADIVRKAQKSGVSSMTFTFSDKNGEVEYHIENNE